MSSACLTSSSSSSPRKSFSACISFFFTPLTSYLSLHLSIFVSTVSSQSFWKTAATPLSSLPSSMICSSFNPIECPAASQSEASGSLITILVFVFLIAEMSTAVGDWSTIMKPSPYVRISAIELLIISTDLPCTFADSCPCSVDVLFSRLCASSIIVTWCNGRFTPFEVDCLYSLNFKTSTPMINAFVSVDPTLLKSTIVFWSNKISSSTGFPLKICPTSPFVSDSTLVTSDPI